MIRGPQRAAGRLALAVAVAAASCDSATEPASPPAVDIAIDIVSSPAITVTRGTSAVVGVRIRDAAGRNVSVAPGTLVWSTGDHGVATVEGEGILRGGPGLGATWVAVEEPGGAADTVPVWVQAPPSDPSSFRISLVFAEDVPAGWRTALDSAAARWESVVRDALPAAPIHAAVGCSDPGPPEMETGVRILVTVSHDYPPGTYVEATGGPCLQRPLPRPTTVLGQIVVNADKPVEEILADRLRYVAVHEMGHVLGLVGVVQGFPPDWFDPVTLVYTGAFAREGWYRERGSDVKWLRVTEGLHWDFGGDVMAQGFFYERIAAVSVGSLMDLGYPAAWYGAGPY